MKHYWLTTADITVLKQIGQYRDKPEDFMSKEDVLAQQTIDADCNDCRHFGRGQITSKAGGIIVWSGHCRKFDQPTKAYPNQYTGRECFEHRRAA